MVISKITRMLNAFAYRQLKYGLVTAVFFAVCGLTDGAVKAQEKQVKRAPVSFDVVSIREARGGGPWLTKFTADGFEAESVPVDYLLRVAFSPPIAPPDILKVPGWTRDTYYDIHAKVDPKDIPAFRLLTREQRGLMLQEILVERFNCKFHYGMVTHSVYDLTVAAHNPKVAQFRSGAGYIGDGNNDAAFKVDGMLRIAGTPDSMAHLARHLSWLADADNKMVIDHTGLSGFYTFHLSWCPEDVTSTNASNCNGPFLFTALKEQLGLELRPDRAQLRAVVIDQIAKATPN